MADAERNRAQTAIPLSKAKSSRDLRALLKIKKMIHLAVSEDVLLTELELAIIDMPDFQRLRGVRQLGSVVWVYPTALHTRFDHSIGTLGMVSRMIAAIRSNSHNEGDEGEISPEQEVLARLYALLHDVTHVPFGHTIEDELSLFPRHDRNVPRILRFLGPDSGIGKLLLAKLDGDLYCRFLAIYNFDPNTDAARLGDDHPFVVIGRAVQAAYGDERFEDYNRIRTATGLTANGLDDAFVYDLVSNTVCADLLDYLARDSYFCGLDVGIKYRFLNFLYLGRDGSGGRRRVFVRLWKRDKPRPRRDTLTDLARLLEARYLVAERAYFHHAKLISGAMIGRALQEAGSAGALKEEALYLLSDDVLLHELATSPATTAAKLATAILQRRLHKSFYSLSAEGIDAVQEQDHEDDTWARIEALVASPEVRRSTEDRISEEIGAEAGDVLIYAPDRKMNMKLAEMKVLWKGRPSALKDIDDRVLRRRLEEILDSHRMLWSLQMFVAPHLTTEQRDLLMRACRLLFETPRVSQVTAKRGYYRRLVERRIQIQEYDKKVLEGSFIDRRDQIVGELLESQHQSTAGWSRVIDNTIAKHFEKM